MLVISDNAIRTVALSMSTTGSKINVATDTKNMYSDFKSSVVLENKKMVLATPRTVQASANIMFDRVTPSSSSSTLLWKNTTSTRTVSSVSSSNNDKDNYNSNRIERKEQRCLRRRNRVRQLIEQRLEQHFNNDTTCDAPNEKRVMVTRIAACIENKLFTIGCNDRNSASLSSNSHDHSDSSNYDSSDDELTRDEQSTLDDQLRLLLSSLMSKKKRQQNIEDNADCNKEVVAGALHEPATVKRQKIGLSSASPFEITSIDRMELIRQAIAVATDKDSTADSYHYYYNTVVDTVRQVRESKMKYIRLACRHCVSSGVCNIADVSALRTLPGNEKVPTHVSNLFLNTDLVTFIEKTSDRLFRSQLSRLEAMVTSTTTTTKNDNDALLGSLKTDTNISVRLPWFDTMIQQAKDHLEAYEEWNRTTKATK